MGAAARRAAADELAEADPPAWRGSEVSIKHSFSALSTNPRAELTYNPTVVQTLSVDPAWRLGARLRLTGHLGVETELTDSDVTSYERQPLLEDTTVTATLAWPELPAGLVATTALRVALPTSKEAIARRRIAALGPTATLARPFAWRGATWRPSLALRATYNWQLSTSLVYDGPSITTCDAERGDACEAFTHAGARSAVAGFAEVLALDVTLPRADLRLTAQAWWVQSWLYDLTPALGPDGAPVPASARGTDWRLAQVWLLGATWQATPRWALAGGFSTENPQRAPDGALYAPFFNRHTQLYLTAAATF